MRVNINKVQTVILNKTIKATEETNSVPYATEMTVSDFGFFLETLKVILF